MKISNLRTRFSPVSLWTLVVSSPTMCSPWLSRLSRGETYSISERQRQAVMILSMPPSRSALNRRMKTTLRRSGARQLHRGQCMLVNIHAFFFKCEPQTQLSLGTSLKHVKDMPKWSLRGIADRVVEKSIRMDGTSKGEGTRLSHEECDRLCRAAYAPSIPRFPYPVQQLILKELRVLEDEEDGDLVPLSDVGDETLCTCLFYRKWQLPCRHILKQEKLFGGILTDGYW